MSGLLIELGPVRYVGGGRGGGSDIGARVGSDLSRDPVGRGKCS